MSPTPHAPKQCPFCGHDNFGGTLFVADQGDKWGRYVCAGCEAHGPEVRTSYDVSKDASWHADALEDWNRRVAPRCVQDLIRALTDDSPLNVAECIAKVRKEYGL